MSSTKFAGFYDYADWIERQYAEAKTSAEERIWWNALRKFHAVALSSRRWKGQKAHVREALYRMDPIVYKMWFKRRYPIPGQIQYGQSPTPQKKKKADGNSSQLLLF